ncbi:haloacid dehalogenase-like hydrolase [Shewanella sp. VB17]|uniref:HAD family hydrolase n=1 Tax=Shewanella sp. VB17 TaxID=2739432 RepID=UPI001566EC45|nr:HAD family hydrolase [Shewanella sp. VB17]NRD74585.1 haloacid dehalogenase-like hydrolase [Shewanella sp. VB17]
MKINKVNHRVKKTLVAVLLFASFNAFSHQDPLPSWNEGESKKNILAFVEKVTQKTSPDFVPTAQRVAVFDNDGTLWSEKPVYFQLLFAMDRVKEMAAEHPEWKTTQPFKAVLENDQQALAKIGNKGLLELVMATHAGLTTAEFRQVVITWLAKAKHPKFDRPYTELVYQPMLEVLTYLRENGFKTYIVSGGGIEFMRPWTEKVYGIPPEQVIGSSIKTEFQMKGADLALVRLPEMDFLDDKEGKPVAIQKFIGQRPIAAFGNSDGDLQMLQWTAAGEGPRFMSIVHHTDEKNEWAYDKDSHVGKLDKALTQGQSDGWTVIDMKQDWKRIYPFQLENN